MSDVFFFLIILAGVTVFAVEEKIGFSRKPGPGCSFHVERECRFSVSRLTDARRGRSAPV